MFGVVCDAYACVVLNQGFGLYPEEIRKLLKGFTEWSCMIRYFFNCSFWQFVSKVCWRVSRLEAGKALRNYYYIPDKREP